MTKPLSIENAVKYGKNEVIRQWATPEKGAEQLGNLLLIAASSKHTNAETLRILLAAGANPDFIKIHTCGTQTYQSGPPLLVTAQHGTLEQINTIIHAGADVHYSESYGFNAMNSAVFNSLERMEPIIKRLLELKISPDVESKHSETPLSVLSRRGLFPMIKLLLDAGANPAPLGWNNLMHAIALGTLEECKTILQSGSDLTASDRLWERTPLLLSIQVGDIEKTALLLKAGASLNDKGRCGKTCLMYATHHNNTEMLQWLITQGADINSVDDFETTALINAATYGAADCVEILLKAGASLHAATDTQSYAITEASSIETVHILVKAGADINTLAGDGYNLLKRVTEKENTAFVHQLLETGADPNVTSTGETPLHLAVIRDNIEIMQLLLQHGANPDAQDVDGYTPLFSVKSLEAAHMLLMAGADPYKTDMFKQSAIDAIANNEIAVAVKNWKRETQQ